MILAGDSGGTNTRLVTFEPRGAGLRAVAEETLPSREHESLEAVLARCFSAHRLSVEGAGFGVAGAGTAPPAGGLRMAHHLAGDKAGANPAIFPGDTQSIPRGCLPPAWSLANTLAAWQAIAGGPPRAIADRAPGCATPHGPARPLGN
jgi:hypothetical protein